MLTILWNLGAFIAALSILVTIHEYGHFWVARRCGVKVHRFSVGFGKVLFKRTDSQGTEFAVAAIPLGGYVKMLDGRVDELTEDDEQFAFDKKTVWQRIAIVAAGPIANFLLAIFVFFIMYMVGINSAKPIINGTAENTPVDVIQTDTPFQVMSVNGQSVGDWEALNLALVGQIGESEFQITIAPLSDTKNQYNLEPTKIFMVSLQDWKFDPKKESIIDSLGFIPYRPTVHLEVADVAEGGAGDKAGLEVGDQLVAVDGVMLNTWQEFVSQIQGHPEQPLNVEVIRSSQSINLNLVPASRENAQQLIQGYIGVAPVVDEYPEAFRVKLQFSPIEAFVKGIEKTGRLTELTFDTLIKLVTGDIAVTNLSGPVAIAKGAGMSANYGIEYFLGFLGLISVNLGLMNLIPLPVLDGGHLLYYCAEIVTGKAIPEKIQEIGYKIGGAVLMTFMVIALLNDLNLLS
ncbi:sigma E protease regulator RseP [Psychromonas sp. PT13]|uniref:sigma E protease regulator RseP n=1 Tax=Psychromonas sp. PT13 TaxID=3439547 RepID=UPI003EBA84AE